jgi:hypothetical protein
MIINDPIIEKIAIKLFRWLPPEPSLVPEGNYTYFHDLGMYIDCDNEIEIPIELWNKSIYWHDKDGKPIKFEGKLLHGRYFGYYFDPINNANHWIGVIRKLEEMGFWFVIDPNPHYYPGKEGEISYDIGFFKPIKDAENINALVYGCKKVTGQVICEAALMAIEKITRSDND